MQAKPLVMGARVGGSDTDVPLVVGCYLRRARIMKDSCQEKKFPLFTKQCLPKIKGTYGVR